MGPSYFPAQKASRFPSGTVWSVTIFALDENLTLTSVYQPTKGPESVKRTEGY